MIIGRVSSDPKDYFDKILFDRIGICYNTYLYDDIIFKGHFKFGSNQSRWTRKFFGIYWRQISLSNKRLKLWNTQQKS